MAKRNGSSVGAVIAGLAMLILAIALAAFTLSTGLGLLGFVASVGVVRGIVVGLKNFGGVLLEAHHKLP